MINQLTLNKGILLNETKLAFQNEDVFKFSLESARVFDLEVMENSGYIGYGFNCYFLKMMFSFNQSFHDKRKDGKPFIIWTEGKCSKLQWNSSRSDLEDDLQTLVRQIELNLNVNASKKNENEVFFLQNGVVFNVFASVQGMNCIIEFNV